MFPSKLFKWLAEQTVQSALAAVFGSAVVTSLVNAALRSVYTPSWEASWVIWSVTALAAYVVILRTSSAWSKFLTGSGSSGPQPTAEMLNAGRKERRCKREQLIRDWREMVAAVQALSEQDDYHGWVLRTLEADPRFMALKPNLTERTKTALYGRKAVVRQEGGWMRGELTLILEDIAALEETWDLR